VSLRKSADPPISLTVVLCLYDVRALAVDGGGGTSLPQFFVLSVLSDAGGFESPFCPSRPTGPSSLFSSWDSVELVAHAH